MRKEGRHSVHEGSRKGEMIDGNGRKFLNQRVRITRNNQYIRLLPSTTNIGHL